MEGVTRRGGTGGGRSRRVACGEPVTGECCCLWLPLASFWIVLVDASQFDGS